MNSIEEDIKILEVENYYLEELGYLRDNNHFIKFNQALKNLIKAYKELEEENSLLIQQNITYKRNINDLKHNNIPVSLVEEKIEERKLWLSSNDIGYKDDYVLEVLQELLEKR